MNREVKGCPFCGSKATIKSYDRLVTIGCDSCHYSIGYGGLLQTEPDLSNKEGGIKPVPKKNSDGTIDYEGGKVKEYYHYKANDNAIEKWNTRVNL